MKYLLGLILIFTSSLSSAGILIEPEVGYVFSHSLKTTATLSYNGASTSLPVNATGTALEYGARVGYQAFGLMAGLNYNNGLSNKGSNVGAFVGYAAPLLFRAWAGYNFTSKVNYTSIATEGTSMEVGFGYTGFPLLSLNFVYRKYDLTKFKYSGVNYTTSGLTPTEMLMGVSVPFNLF